MNKKIHASYKFGILISVRNTIEENNEKIENVNKYEMNDLIRISFNSVFVIVPVN